MKYAILLYYRFERVLTTKLFLIQFKWLNCIYNDLYEWSKIIERGSQNDGRGKIEYLYPCT